MCGIAGFFGRQQRPAAVAAAMLAALAKRGPDAQHHVAWDGAWQPTVGAPVHALLHARLAIIDPRPEADQPMSNADGSVWLCYNGEVYDWQADAAALQAQGVVFRTRSDTEFILHGYQAWGIDGLLARLRGMFAFAIVDLRQQKVWLARDRMGEKPLLYAHVDGELAFGSLLRAVLPWLPADRRQFDAQGIDAYLTHRTIPAPRTVFRDIRRLANGELLEYSLADGSLRQRSYWQPQATAGDWRDSLDAAITMRTVADRPLGLFLSSGIDSTLLACRLQATGQARLQTFTAAFPGSAMDESDAAAEIAGQLGLDNTRIVVPTTIAADFAGIVADLDEPFADPSSFPSWYLARSTSQHVKVVLGGDGGDELLAGYKRIAKHLRQSWRGDWRLPLPMFATPASKGWQKLADELRMDWRSAYSLRFSGCTPSQRAFLQPALNDALPHYWRPAAPLQAGAVHRLLAIDLANYLPEYILRKTDLCTMAHGLEGRAPLVDHVWYQHLLSVPDGERFTRPAKHLLAERMPQVAALDLFGRKKKGFNPPLAHWLRVDLAERQAGLGERLQALTGGQLDAGRTAALLAHFGSDGSLAEQVLQLLILDESLAQLAALAAVRH